MFKDSVIKENYFNTIFSEKHFEFINNFNNEITELNSKISYQEDLKNKVVQLINILPEFLKQDSSKTDTHSLYKLSTEISNIYKLINENIQMLSELGNKLNSLKSELSTLIADIEQATYPEEYYKLTVYKLKLEIDNYYSFLQKTNEKLDSNNFNIDTFLTNVNTKKYLDKSGIQINENLSPSDNTTNEEPCKINLPKQNEENNNTLVISEKDNKIFLPYTIEEIEYFLDKFPEQYNSFESVVSKEFILPLDYYMSHPAISRFKAAYALSKYKEDNSIFESIKYAMEMMTNKRINPAIIAACKTQEQLKNYIYCLNCNNLNNFKDFEIKFEINPL